MNTIVLDTPRGKVTQRLRYIYSFCPPLRAPTNTPRPPLGESATTGNRYLLLLINALESPQKEPERIHPPLHTPPKPAVGELN